MAAKNYHNSDLSMDFNKMSNDPWQPVVNTSYIIPTINSSPVDPLRNMKSSESYVQSLGMLFVLTLSRISPIEFHDVVINEQIH